MTPEQAHPRSNADLRTTLGDLVRGRRRTLGLTQQDLADLADVGVRLVHEVEHDADAVQMKNVVRLLAALGLHLEVAAGARDRVGTEQVADGHRRR
jgi:y4mF family transcriptional regulator